MAAAVPVDRARDRRTVRPPAAPQRRVADRAGLVPGDDALVHMEQQIELAEQRLHGEHVLNDDEHAANAIAAAQAFATLAVAEAINRLAAAVEARG